MRAIFVLMLVALLAAPITTSAEPGSTPEPTSLGQAIVTFDSLPAVAPGGTLAGLPVLTVEPRADYIVVAADDLRDVRQALATWPGVLAIEDDAIMSAFAVPDDARYNQQYGPAMMGAHDAWSTVGWGSSDITVAVLDTGIRATHQDLAANYVGGYDYVNNDNNPNDDCGHGTHVSGTVAAVTDNGIGVAGMSQASIIHHKVLGATGGILNVQCSGSSSDINAAIMDAADQGADIISMSLGGGGYSTAGDNAVNYAYNKGSLVVAASGNDSNSNSVSYPAAYDNAIAVGALTSSKSRASYSNGGAELEIAAPGSNVESTYNGNDADYDSLSGTSMATPHVAGALALALSCAPSTSHTQLRSLMQSTAEDLGSSGWDNLYGHGLLRIDNLVDAVGPCGGGPGNGDPTASFTHDATDLTVDFDGSGSSDPDGDSLSYSWTFGDGSSGSGLAPSHTYGADGTYTVTLTVDDGNGGSDASSTSITVSAGGPAGCGAGFGDPELDDGESESISVSDWAYRQICVPDDATSITVTMDGPSCGLAGCSFDADLYTRDGARASSSAYDCRPYQSGSDESCTLSVSGGWVSIAIHAYSGSGTVTLTADHNGAGTPPSNDPPTASFSHGTDDLTADFDASASSDPDGDSLSFSWDFGDGNGGTGVAPSHTYASAGTYTVALTVDDGNGGSDQASASVTVSEPANQAPTASFGHSTDGLTADFDASASSDPDGDSLSYSWDFGDGNSGSGLAPAHAYTAAGTYTVTLTVDDGNGGSDQASSSVTVSAPAGCSGGANVAELDGSEAVGFSSGQWTYRKVCVPSGASVLDIVMDGENCGLFGCGSDADLYVKQSGLPTSISYDCRPYQSGSDESCSFSNPTAGWYYVGVYGYSGSGTVTLSESN